MEKGAQSIIIIKKKKGHGHGHHGGSWKVAFADFMTAMMAFFLLLWLLETTTPGEQEAIAGYFKNPGNEFIIGPGGADSGVLDLKPEQKEADPKDAEVENPIDSSGVLGKEIVVKEELLRQQFEAAELKQLEELRETLETEINSLNSVFEFLKEQILIDFTALGLRIQIVDKEQRPMFDVGSARLKNYSIDVLHALAPTLDKVPNKISITGHTDAVPYGAGASYTNWELSADRANSARRALLEGGYPEAKVVTVQGMGSVAPFLADAPDDPINRRIAIIVLKSAVAEALSKGASGLKSSDFVDTPSALMPDGGDSGQRIMSESEIDAAIDAEIKRKNKAAEQ